MNQDSTFQSDILIANGKILEIGKNLIAPEGSRVINLEKKFVVPGGIDVSV